MLYTTKEIAEMYRVSSYKVTQDWCQKGLKHTYDFKFKKEWVEEFLEETAVQKFPKNDIKRRTVLKVDKNYKKLTMEEIMGE
jgi:hypothetical protein